MKRNKRSTALRVFNRRVTVNTFGEGSSAVILWTQHGELNMSRPQAKQFVGWLIDGGVTVQAYWRNCTARERRLNKRIKEGERV